jgi:hypothetical protein
MSRTWTWPPARLFVLEAGAAASARAENRMLFPRGDQLTPIEFTIISADVVISPNPRPFSLTTKRLATSFASLRAKTSRFPFGE